MWVINLEESQYPESENFAYDIISSNWLHLVVIVRKFFLLSNLIPTYGHSIPFSLARDLGQIGGNQFQWIKSIKLTWEVKKKKLRDNVSFCIAGQTS